LSQALTDGGGAGLDVSAKKNMEKIKFKALNVRTGTSCLWFT
jgi:hypothetical protein